MEKDYKKAEYYENRELSWLGFDERILGITERYGQRRLYQEGFVWYDTGTAAGCDP